eukprot:jgi/Tetstr1/444860/TSEL_032702.t1
MGEGGKEAQRLAELIATHPNHLSALPDGRVRCELNGHVFPASGAAAAVAAFVSGAKFRKLAAAAAGRERLAKLAPFLVPSRNFPDRLWCALTRQLLAADAGTAKRHMAGRKFQNAKERFAADAQDLYEEPDMEEDEEGADDEEAAPMEEDALAPVANKGKGRAGGKGAGGRREGKGTGKGKGQVAKQQKQVDTGEDEPAEFWVPEWAEEAALSGSEGEGGAPVGPVAVKAKKAKRNPNKHKAKRVRPA